MLKTCIKCGKSRPVTDYTYKNKKAGRRNARCKNCTRAAIRAAYYKNRNHYLRYRAQYNKNVRAKRQKFIWSYLLEYPRVDCGIDDPIVLQFDHVRGKKEGMVSWMLLQDGRPMDVVLKEMEKCEVRCANCHIRKTARDFGHYKKLRDYEKALSKD